MVCLQLQPEIEAQLVAEAQAHGMELDRYIETIVAAHVTEPIEPLDEAQLSQDLKQGLREITEGNARPAREVFAELREEYGIRG